LRVERGNAIQYLGRFAVQHFPKRIQYSIKPLRCCIFLAEYLCAARVDASVNGPIAASRLP
jgi:hypothetical protein